MKVMSFSALSSRLNDSPMMLTALGVAIMSMYSASSVHAQGVATEKEIQTITVSGERSPLAPHLPSSTATLKAEDLRLQQNVFNPEDALNNLPNINVRKRYTGDRNALVSGRSFGSTQAPRALVLMDGYLLSNFLGRFDAPRWNMLMPEEIERVDMIYGPFSAIYPGNSIGNTLLVTTRRPKRFESAVRFAWQRENYEAYRSQHTLTNTQGSAMLGDQLESGLWYRLSVNQQNSTGHPMQYYTINANNAGVFVQPSGNQAATEVTGIQYDTAPTGQRRAVLGANAGAIDHTLQKTLKLRMGFEPFPQVSADAMLAYWDHDSDARNFSFLRDKNQQQVWSGRVTQDGNVFDIPMNTFAPSIRDEGHAQLGLGIKTRYGKGWNASAVLSQYQVIKDQQRKANSPDPIAALGGTGSLTDRDGTHFRTFELQSTYQPQAGDWGNGQHSLSMGLHANDYRLRQVVQTISSDWHVGTGKESERVEGDTHLWGIYVQDAWRLSETWKATLGARQEWWQALNGLQQFSTTPKQIYPQRNIHAFSPKAALSWEVSDDVSTRLALGKGTRFATVAELFQGTQTGSTITINDPNLKPEKSTAIEWMVEKRLEQATLRASVFQDRIQDTIWSQTNLTVFPNITNVQNVDLVRVRGLELVAQVSTLAGIKGLTMDANAAWNRAVILENKNFPNSVGKVWVRIPRFRGSMTMSYAANEQWNVAGTWRYQGRQYGDMLNLDVNPDTYGGNSRIRQLDLRVVHRPNAQWQISAGVDNVNNYYAFQYHPLPARQWFAEVRYFH